MQAPQFMAAPPMWPPPPAWHAHGRPPPPPRAPTASHALPAPDPPPRPAGHHLHGGQLAQQEGAAEPAERRERVPPPRRDERAHGVRCAAPRCAPGSVPARARLAGPHPHRGPPPHGSAALRPCTLPSSCCWLPAGRPKDAPAHVTARPLPPAGPPAQGSPRCWTRSAGARLWARWRWVAGVGAPCGRAGRPCRADQPRLPQPVQAALHGCHISAVLVPGGRLLPCRAPWRLRATPPPPSSCAASPATWSRWVGGWVGGWQPPVARAAAGHLRPAAAACCHLPTAVRLPFLLRILPNFENSLTRCWTS